MLPFAPRPVVRLGNLFPDRRVYAKCEHLAPSGCFKIRGAVHLLEHLTKEGKQPPLIVPSMGNTALGAATAAKEFGFRMVGVVPTAIAAAKDEKLRALGVDLMKIEGGGSELLARAAEVAKERGGYFVHPHLDPLWTDGYQPIAAEILAALPDCKSLVFPLGGGGLLMGLLAHVKKAGASVRLFGVEPFNYPKYAAFSHARSTTIADGLKVEKPHPIVQEAIAKNGIAVSMVQEDGIRQGLRELFEKQGIVVEPSSAVTLPLIAPTRDLPEPICLVLTGENVAREDHRKLIAA